MKTFRRRIALALLIVFCLHVGLAVFYVFSTGTSIVLPGILRTHHYVAHIGPFFRIDRLKTTYHVVIASDDEEPVDLSVNYITRYHHRPWSYQSILARDYLRGIMNTIQRGSLQDSAMTGQQTFNQRISRFLLSENLVSMDDSVTCFYIAKRINTQSVESDTLAIVPVVIAP